jgi:hypothetical protein
MVRLRAGAANHYVVSMAGRKPAFSIVYGRGTAAVFALGAAGSSVRSSMLLLHLDGLAALK